MRRKLFTLVAGAQAVLCIAVCVLWVRSYWVGDSFDWETSDGRAGTASRVGRLHVGAVHLSAGMNAGVPRGVRYGHEPAAAAAATALKTNWSFAAIQYAQLRLPQVRAWEVRVPHACIAAPLAALPAWWLLARRKAARRAAHHLCPACGYDLRATPDRCPECGTVPAKAAT
jgi:hypothetical protein